MAGARSQRKEANDPLLTQLSESSFVTWSELSYREFAEVHDVPIIDLTKKGSWMSNDAIGRDSAYMTNVTALY